MSTKRGKQLLRIISVSASIIGIVGVIWTIFFQDNASSNSYGNQSPNIQSEGDVKVEYNSYTINENKNQEQSIESQDQEYSIKQNDTQNEEFVNIEYSIEKSQSNAYNSLIAVINGQTYVLIDSTEEICIDILAQKDFNNNNTLDFLVTNIIGCGGNCCANSFFFYTYIGDGHFIETDEFGYSWNDPEIEKWKDKWSVYVTSHNEGVNSEEPEEIKERYILDGYKLTKVEESKRMNIRSIKEITSDQIVFNDTIEVLSLLYDLNVDGVDDTIITRPWDRWGRMFWEVHFSDGDKFKSSTGVKRLGVLKTKTNGYHDLVLDQDQVLKWDSNIYK